MNAVVSLPNVDALLDPAQVALAFETCPEGLAIVDDARILYANSAFASLFGYSYSSEIRNRRLADFLPEDRLCTQAGSEQHAACQNTACGYPGCRFEGKPREGRAIAMEASCARFTSRGRTLLVIAAHDISRSERRRVVRDSERRFRTIFDASAIGIGHATLDARIVESNRALENMLGYSHDELRGMSFGELFHSDDVGGGTELFQELAAGKRDNYQLELRYGRKDRGSGWARLTVSLVRGPDSSPEFAIAMVEDVTERKRAEQQLREAQKMEAIGRLVGGVAHDFNNLLTGIMLYCDLLRSGLEPGNQQRHHAEEIRLASEHGAALIQQLLAVARQQVVEPQILSLNDVVFGMRDLLARLIGENVKLVTNLAPGLDSVKIDPAQVQQIVLNLVLNARDAMPEGGQVTLETRNFSAANVSSFPESGSLSGCWVVLSVSDTGCGMSAETRCRLFEPFFTTKRPGKGNGLGLSTVHGAVKQCGGTIEVQTDLGHGTCIRILLPSVERPVAASQERSASSSVTGRETVLIVEDDPAVRHAARHLLSEHGYMVLEAANGLEALDTCRNHEGEIHLMLSDIVLPGMSGQLVAEQAVSLRPAMKVLYASGYSQTTDGQGLPEPAVLFRKPFSGEALLRKVREVLNQNELESAKRKR